MLVPLLLLTVFAYVLYDQFIGRRRRYPAGPLPLPLLGNALMIDEQDPARAVNKAADERGGICTVWFGVEANVIITDYEIMREAFVTHGECLSDRPNSSVMQLAFGGMYGLVLSTGEHWRRQRRFSLHALRDFGFGRNLMEAKVNVELDRLVEYMNGRLDPAAPLTVCIGSIIASVAISERYAFENDATFERLLAANTEMFEAIQTLPILLLNNMAWLSHVPLFGHFGLDRVQRAELEVRAHIPRTRHATQFRNYFMPMIEACDRRVRSEEADVEPDSYMHAFMLECNRRRLAGEPADGFDTQQLYVALSDLWGAGVETTTTTLEWAILYMATLPDVQNKARAEIDSVLVGRRVTMADKLHLPYTAATLLEVQRCGNIVPINLQHATKHDVTIAGRHIPAGTTVIAQVSAVHDSEQHFERAHVFNPQRFIDKPECVEKVMPFSLGRRQCLGESLARTELFMIFVTLLQMYTWHAPDGVDVHACMKPRYRFTRHPSPYEMIFERRHL